MNTWCVTKYWLGSGRNSNATNGTRQNMSKIFIPSQTDSIHTVCVRDEERWLGWTCWCWLHGMIVFIVSVVEWPLDRMTDELKPHLETEILYCEWPTVFWDKEMSVKLVETGWIKYLKYYINMAGVVYGDHLCFRNLWRTDLLNIESLTKQWFQSFLWATCLFCMRIYILWFNYSFIFNFNFF